MPIIRTVQTLAREEVLTAMSEGWTEYVRRVTEGLPRRDIAAAAGIHVSGVSRWLSGDQPSAEKVISFARGLHQSPIQALVAAGYLEPTDVNGPVAIVQSLKALSDEALIDQLSERLIGRLVDHPQAGEAGLSRLERQVQKVRVEKPDKGHHEGH